MNVGNLHGALVVTPVCIDAMCASAKHVMPLPPGCALLGPKQMHVAPPCKQLTHEHYLLTLTSK